MSVDPFIEAEDAAGHSVKNACHLLEVSRAAYYQRRKGVPSARELSDAELAEQITAVHAESKGTYGSPRVHQELHKRGVDCGKRRVRRLICQVRSGGKVQEALAQDHRGRPGGRGGLGPHSARLRARG